MSPPAVPNACCCFVCLSVFPGHGTGIDMCRCCVQLTLVYFTAGNNTLGISTRSPAIKTKRMSLAGLSPEAKRLHSWAEGNQNLTSAARFMMTIIILFVHPSRQPAICPSLWQDLVMSWVWSAGFGG